MYYLRWARSALPLKSNFHIISPSHTVHRNAKSDFWPPRLRDIYVDLRLSYPSLDFFFSSIRPHKLSYIAAAVSLYI